MQQMICPESTFNCATSAGKIVNFGTEMLSLRAGEFGDPLKQKYTTTIYQQKKKEKKKRKKISR